MQVRLGNSHGNYARLCLAARPSGLRLTLASLALLATLGACSGGDTTTAGTPDGAPPVTTPQTGPDGKPVDHGVVIAEVGGIPIYADEFQAAASRKTPAEGGALSDAERKEVLDKLVEEKALYLEAKKKGVDLDPKVQKVMVNTLLRNEVYATVRNSDFSDEELKAYFDAHHEDFVVPEKVQIRRIFVRVDEQRTDDAAKALADDIHKQVVANPSKFGDIATEKSEDPYRRRGGDLGYVGHDGKPGIDQAVIDKAFEMKVDEVSAVFQAGGGYNIITVAGKRERVERTFDQMRGSVLRKVKNERYKELYDKYVSTVKGQYPVTVHEAEFAGVKVEPARTPMPGGPGALPPGIRAPGEFDGEPGEGMEMPPGGEGVSGGGEE